MNNFTSLFKKILLPATLALLLSGTLITHSFTEPQNAPSQGSLPAPLNTSDAPQKKAGGIVLNAAGLSGTGAPIGLSVYGYFGIGFPAGANPTAALDLIGNFFISGALKPNGISGTNDQILTIDSSGNSMKWANRFSWLSLVGAAKKPASCPNGQIDPGETCSNCPDAACPSSQICWQGQCVIPPGGGGPACGNGVCEPFESCSSCSSDCGACPGGTCGNGVIDPQTEQCDPALGGSGGCMPVQVSGTSNPATCGAGTPQSYSYFLPAICTSTCQCANPYIPPADICGPPPPGGPPGPVIPVPPGDTGPPPPPGGGGGGCGVVAGGPQGGGGPIQCGGSCPADSTCQVTGVSPNYCECLPTPPDPIQNQQIRNDFNEYLSRWQGIKVVESASHCANPLNPAPQPPNCPTIWIEYETVCGELADGSSIWIRTCYKDK